MSLLTETAPAWPAVATAAIAAAGLRAGRRRGALNEALHELRRPLQAIALAAGPGIDGSVRLAAAALERLDCEINGKMPIGRRGRVDLKSLLAASVRRWQGRARLSDASLVLRWESRVAVVGGDAEALAQALDNLIVNAIEHGGPRIVLEARSTGSRLRIAVLDSGRGSRPASRAGSPAETIARLTGGHRRGHGLNVVRRVAATHDGRFSLRTRAQGSAAVIELPLAPARDRQAT